MRDDLRAAFRSLTASRTFTVVALMVLTLGIGATTAIFSVVDAVVLRALPFDEHDRLVAVGERRIGGLLGSSNRDPLQLSSVAPQNFLDWAAGQQAFESIAAIAGGAMTLQEAGGEPEELRSQRVTAGFFDVLRSRPALGRAFNSEHEVEGRHRVAVISDTFWRRRFSADPTIVGRTLALDAGVFEVIGVMPPEFTYPVGVLRPTDLWVPYVVPQSERVRLPNSYSVYLQVIARLKPGISVTQAQLDMDRVSAGLQAAHPKWNEGVSAGVRPLIDHLLGAATRSWLLLLLGAVGLVLLIACANVANLQLARSTTRGREMGIRAALGAGRWRLARQLLIESLALAIVASLCGIVLAWWMVGFLKTAMPDGVPRVSQIALDLRVVGAAAALALVTGVAFGLVPALQSSQPDVASALKEGGRGSTDGGRQWFRNALVVAEVALAVVLLVGAALFLGSFVTVMRIDPGFNPSNVLTVQVTPRWEPGLRDVDASRQYLQIVDTLASAPGVTHAAIIAGGMPLSGAMTVSSLEVPGRVVSRSTDISLRRVTAAYHETLRIPLRSGRFFAADDRKGSPNVVIINESAAARYFPGERAVGRAVKVDEVEAMVVGVVGDVHQTSLETAPRAEAYVPLAQHHAGSGDLLVRTSGDPYRVLPAVKSAIHAALPTVPLRGVRTMEELIERRTAQRRLTMLLLSLFGLLGLVIAAVGVYGLLAYVVAQRTREIGVRMALGATRSAVITMVLRSAALMVAAGLLLGGAGAWYLSAMARTFLFRLEPTDPRAFAAAMSTLALAALIASAIPARRAARVDPMTALRE